MFCEEIQHCWEYLVAGHHMRVVLDSSSCVKDVQANTSLELQKHKSFLLLLAALLLLPQSLQSINIWDNLPLPPLYQADSKSSLGYIHCYLIPAVNPPTPTHTHIHFIGNTVPTPACMVASIFHNASCNSVRYVPWFHLCGAMVALLSALKWNSCGSMSLICQTDGVFTFFTELQ